MKRPIFLRAMSVLALGATFTAFTAGCAAAEDPSDDDVADAEGAGEPVETASSAASRSGCWSDTRGRWVPVGTRVVSKYNGNYYECGRNGRWHRAEPETPLVFAFDPSRPIDFGTRPTAEFDLAGAGMCAGATDWPSAATPWLALDRNGNGAIDDGRELFGSASPLARGGRPANGFEPLAELDADGDGRITPADPAWSALTVWADRDGDRVSTPSELSTLDDLGILSIDLGYHVARACDARGNCGIERASFTFRRPDGTRATGAVVDVHLPFR